MVSRLSGRDISYFAEIATFLASNDNNLKGKYKTTVTICCA